MLKILLGVMLLFSWSHPDPESVNKWTLYYTETSGDYSDDLKGNAVAYCADEDLDGMWECTADTELPDAQQYYFKLTGSNEWGESEPTQEIGVGQPPVRPILFAVTTEGDP